jgi:hypothetical protein
MDMQTIAHCRAHRRPPFPRFLTLAALGLHVKDADGANPKIER